ncbi:hypothetical protein CALCODRAFT_516717 [Calocera cornea HHB12733]|uniref:Uncharacterized protein n=1 Tax=Calocera cornea HHB12733 TaxID=1353952 RepID=A0A165GUS9_9BASI|nr:hypothetical protein CALCODRAFT_516717 [Calocera cornea HHB12733]
MEEMHRAVAEILDGTRPNPIPPIKRALASRISRIVYSRKIDSFDDPYIVRLTAWLHDLAKGKHPGKYMVELCPMLRYLPTWLPGAGFRREGERFGEEALELTDEPFNTVKLEMSTGAVPPSFISNLLEDDHGKMINDPAEEDRSKATIITFIIAMLKEPGRAS